MKRWIAAASIALSLTTAAFAEDTVGRAIIRTAGNEPTAPMPSSAPMATAPAGPVAGVVTGNCANGQCGGTVASGRADSPIQRFFRDLFGSKTCGPKGCGPFQGCGGILGRNYGGTYGSEFNPYPNGVPGTLVFPQHPFVRSPRDFFMWEPK